MDINKGCSPWGKAAGCRGQFVKRDVMMTQNIIRHDGVIADLQGGSVLGFWGWPLGLDEGALPACWVCR